MLGQPLMQERRAAQKHTVHIRNRSPAYALLDSCMRDSIDTAAGFGGIHVQRARDESVYKAYKAKMKL